MKAHLLKKHKSSVSQFNPQEMDSFVTSFLNTEELKDTIDVSLEEPEMREEDKILASSMAREVILRIILILFFILLESVQNSSNKEKDVHIYIEAKGHKSALKTMQQISLDDDKQSYKATDEEEVIAMNSKIDIL